MSRVGLKKSEKKKQDVSQSRDFEWNLMTIITCTVYCEIFIAQIFCPVLIITFRT